MSFTAQQLLDLKKKIEDAGNTKIELQTKKSILLEKAKTEYSCTSISELNTSIEEDTIALQKIEEDLEQSKEVLEEKYDFAQ